MPKTLAELIADAAADENLEFAAPDGTKFKLADVRGFKSGIETEHQAAKRARQDAEKTALEARQIFEALKSAQEEMNKNTKVDDKPAKGSDWRKNPLYDEIVPVFDALEAKANQAAERAEKIAKSLETSQAQYIAEKFKREWAEAKVKPKDARFQDVVAEVLKAQEMDDLGLPTLNKYLYRATEQDRLDAYAAKKVEDAKKEWDKAQHAASIPKPGAGGKFQTRKSGEGPIKKLDELTSDIVANDPDIPSIDGFVQ